MVFKIREIIHKLDKDGGRIFEKILFSRKDHLRPKSHPRIHPRLDLNLPRSLGTIERSYEGVSTPWRI